MRDPSGTEATAVFEMEIKMQVKTLKRKVI